MFLHKGLWSLILYVLVLRLQSSVVHKYSHPGTFVVAVECTSRDMQITAQKIMTIQEPVRAFGVIMCYAGKLSFHATNCKALYGETFQIQMELKAGSFQDYFNIP